MTAPTYGTYLRRWLPVAAVVGSTLWVAVACGRLA